MHLSSDVESGWTAEVHASLGFQIAKEMHSVADEVPKLLAAATVNALLRAHGTERQMREAVHVLVPTWSPSRLAGLVAG